MVKLSLIPCRPAGLIWKVCWLPLLDPWKHLELILQILKRFIALSYESQMLLNLFLDADGVSLKKEKKKKLMPELCSAGEIVAIYVVGFFPKG